MHLFFFLFPVFNLDFLLKLLNILHHLLTILHSLVLQSHSISRHKVVDTVVLDRVIQYQVEVTSELVESHVLVPLSLVLHSLQVHGLLNDLKVVRGSLFTHR